MLMTFWYNFSSTRSPLLVYARNHKLNFTSKMEHCKTYFDFTVSEKDIQNVAILNVSRLTLLHNEND